MNKKVYLAALHKIWITHKKLFILFEKDNNYEEIYKDLDNKLLIKIWYTSKQSENIIIQKNKLNIEKFIKYILELNIKIIDFFDKNYIKNFHNIERKPFLYYLKWEITLPWISFIWSRIISSYWKNAIEKILPDVGKYFTIISGWAYGCDSYSHKIALSNNIKTISIIWTGIDINYPSVNEKMYEEIVKKWWWILSVFPIWEKPNPYNFPIRNEIVSCISEWIVIVEAKEKSWSLITANLWLEQWKDIFCVPNDIFKQNSSGCNNFISKWYAKLITNSNDILEEYNIWNTKNKKNNKEIIISDDIEREIYELLLLEWLSIDNILNKTNYQISIISFKLSMLEINNLIKKSDSWKYEII